MKIKQKKSQITIFVIIGIIIITAAAVFFFSRRTSQAPSNEELISAASDVPLEFQPIRDFVESCIAKTGKEGIEQIGFHGGYTDLNRYGIQAKAANPTESSAFFFNSQDKESGVAYWNYFKSSNRCEKDCMCGSQQPYLYKTEGSPSIEKQLQDYLNEKLKTCLREFKAFANQGFEISAPGDVKTSVNVREKDVLFTVSYKINAKKDSSRFSIDQFIKSVPVKLKKIYEMASLIRESEANTSFIEWWTMEQIAGFGLGAKDDRIPPIAASELDPGKKPTYWIKQKVKDDIANDILPAYTPFLSVFGTNNFNNDIAGTFYERAVVPMNASRIDSRDLSLKFSYLNWWPIYFDITGRGISGQRIGPETASSSLMTFIGIKRYNFYYDISYPVLVDIYSEDAFNNEGFHFYVGLESNVRNNKPVNCSGPGLTQYTIASGSMMCNYDQGCANVTIETKDAKTDSALEKATIFYSLEDESCNKGFTEINGNTALLDTSLPQCVGSGCSINAVKDGYWSYPVTAAVLCSPSQKCSDNRVLCNREKVTLKLEPLRNNSVSVMKKKMIKQAQKTWVFSNTAEELLDDEYATISLERIKENPNEADFFVSGVFYGNQSSIQMQPGLIPGNYQLNINLFYQLPDSKRRDAVIFKKVRECQDTLFGLDEECFDLGPYNFTENFVEGGFVANITLTKDLLDNYDNIDFYAISAPDADTSYDVLDVYDLEEIGKLEQYSNQYKVELKPTGR